MLGTPFQDPFLKIADRLLCSLNDFLYNFRLLIMHMVTPDGLIPEAERLWIRKNKKQKIIHEDYHFDIEFETYFNW